MNFLNYLKFKRESFSAKIFYLVTVSILIIYFSFSAFFVYYHGRMMRNNFINEGRHLAGILAYSLKLGVFTENTDLFRGPLEGFMHYDEAIGVQIYTDDGRELKSLVRPGVKNAEKLTEARREVSSSAIEYLKKGGADFYFEHGNNFEFWSPVVSGERYSEEALISEDNISRAESRIIGFVRIVLTAEARNKGLKDVLFKGIIIPVIFLIPGWIIAYFIVRGITRPLERLTKGVKALETTGSFEMVSVDTKDEVGKLASAFNDMAESLRKREAEKQELEEQLRHSEKMKAIGTFAGGIAHDFNNIITVIKSYAQLLQKKKLEGDDEDRFLHQILLSAEKASSLTRSLLASSRKQTIIPHPVKLNMIITNVEEILRRLLDEHIEFKVGSVNENLIVMADKGYLEHVLINLATNARDAMPDGGTLTITTRSVELDKQPFMSSGDYHPGRYAMITFTDTGKGMDKQTKESIFDPFFTTKDVGKGTGLGLFMAYGIIQQLGGHIDVRSAPGKGTAFDIYLPLSDAIIEERESDEIQMPKGGTETILLAEDDDDVRKLIVTVLKLYGYDVIESGDGEEAVEKFIHNKDGINFLLLDLIMPKKNGKEVYEEILKVRPDIKALFISGYSADVSIREEGINFLSKPISTDELLGKVREILDDSPLCKRGVRGDFME